MAEDPVKLTERIHTVTWDDPASSARDARAIGGLEYLEGIRTGKVSPPPVARLVGYRIRDVEPGSAVFELEPAEYHYNPFRTVHGGIATTLLDTAMTAAVLSTLPKGLACSTLEIKVNFIRPITAKTGLVRSEARAIHVGKRVATAEARILDDRQDLFAHAVSTFAIFSVKG